MSYKENFLMHKGVLPLELTAASTGVTTNLVSGDDAVVRVFTNLPIGTYSATSYHTIKSTTANTTLVSNIQDLTGNNIVQNQTSQFGYPNTSANNAVIANQFKEIVSVTSNTNTMPFACRASINAGSMQLNDWRVNSLILQKKYLDRIDDFNRMQLLQARPELSRCEGQFQ